ncbi:MAG: ABC transporter permease [Clostridia bacterium]|nr:ABC transporter permease [Clostridia bacterium]
MAFLKSLLKEIRDNINDFTIMILLVAGPIALTVIFGGAYFNTYVEDMPIAILDNDNSSMSRMMVQQFEESDRFVIQYRVDSEAQLKELLDSGKIIMGLCIPQNFSNDVKTLKSSEVLVIVNGTNIVTGNNSFAQASTIIQTIAAGVQIKTVEAKGIPAQVAKDMVMSFKFDDRMLYDPRNKYLNYLIFGYIAVFLQQVMLSGLGFSILRDAKEVAAKNTLGKVGLKFLACAVFALTSTFAAIEIAVKFFGVPLKGSILAALLLASIFSISIVGPVLIIAALTGEKLKYAQISFMLSLPAFITCGYVWPLDQMPSSLVLAVKLLWPLASFARSFDELLIKGFPMSSLKGDMLSMMIYTIFWLPIAIFIFKKKFKRNVITGVPKEIGA